MFISVSRAAIEELDAARNGGPVNFSIELHCDIAQASGGGVRTVFSGSESLTVKKGDWVELPEQIGHARRVLLEVDRPDAVNHPELARAVGHLEGAQGHAALGDWRPAVGECRDVLDALKMVLGDDEKTPAEVEFFTKGFVAFDKAERIRLLRRAARVFCAPARHVDKVTVDMSWERDDAQAMIAIRAALLQQTKPRKP